MDSSIMPIYFFHQTLGGYYVHFKHLYPKSKYNDLGSLQKKLKILFKQ